jgi:hypothetical protein
MLERQSHRRQVPLWQIAPFLLIPPALVAAISLYWDLSLIPFITTFTLTCLALVMLTLHRPDREPAMRHVTPAAQKPRRD